jgi:hypothetical protein
MVKLIIGGVCIFVLYKLMLLTDQITDVTSRLVELETQLKVATK